MPAKHLQLGSTTDFSFFEIVSSYVDQVGLEKSYAAHAGPQQPTLAPSSPSYSLRILNAVIRGCCHLTPLLHLPVSIISSTSDKQTPLPAWKDYGNNKIKIVLSQGLSRVANAFIFLHLEGGGRRSGEGQEGSPGPRRLALLTSPTTLDNAAKGSTTLLHPLILFPAEPLHSTDRLIRLQTKLSAFELNHTIIIHFVTLVLYQRESQRKNQHDIPTAIMKFFKP